MISRVYAYIAGTLLLVVFVAFRIVKHKDINRTVLISCFILYLTAIAAITLFPIYYSHSMYGAGKTLKNAVQLKPFRTISPILKYGSNKLITEQIFCNVIMTLPFGIMFPMILKRRKPYICLPFMIIFPLLIEGMQLLLGMIAGTYYRMCDIDDVILNTLGAAVGYIIYIVFSFICSGYYSSSEKS